MIDRVHIILCLILHTIHHTYTITMSMMRSTSILRSLPSTSARPIARAISSTAARGFAQPTDQKEAPVSSKPSNMKEFKIYRWNPDTPAEKPKLQSYKVDLSQCGPMMLDALVRYKLVALEREADKVDQDQERGRPYLNFPSFMP